MFKLTCNSCEDSSLVRDSCRVNVILSILQIILEPTVTETSN